MRSPAGPLRLELPEAGPPGRRRAEDWGLATAVAGTTLVEVLLRDELSWRPVALVLGLALAVAVLVRRTHPLVAVGIGIGGFLVVDLATWLASTEPVVLYAGFVVLVLVFALARWGTAREIGLGSVVALTTWAVAVLTAPTGSADAVGGLAVLLLAAALGLTLRYRHGTRVQRLARLRAEERESLARDLHDTVAHHVTAIAVQAQAGRVLVASDDIPGAVAALEVIEAEASRTLSEMRSIVRTLRGSAAADEGESADTTSTAGLAGLRGLTAEATGSTPAVAVALAGDLGGLSAAVESALYRIAQEAVTNAHRHAVGATRVRVHVEGAPAEVVLTVEDDGTRAATPAVAGFGLLGMRERARMLGGSLEAGPDPDGGWAVRARLPREAAVS